MKGVHAARQEPPKAFEEFRNKPLTDGVMAVVGRRKGSDTWEIQSVHLDADKFTPKEARDWLEQNGFSTDEFEEALEEDKAEATADLAPNEAEAHADFMARCVAAGHDEGACQLMWESGGSKMSASHDEDEEDDEDEEYGAAGQTDLQAWDPDQARDEGGRWTSGGGGGGSGGGKADRETRSRQKTEGKELAKTHARREKETKSARDKEDKATTRQRDKEDRQTQRERDKEDRATQRQRDKEDRDIQKARDKEDKALGGKVPKEFQKRRDEDDARRERSREEKDKLREMSRDRDDELKQTERDTEDTARDATREKEDAALSSQHEQERTDLDKRHEGERAAAKEKADADRRREQHAQREASKVRRASERDAGRRRILREAEQRGQSEPKPMSRADERDAERQRQESERQQRFDEGQRREREQAGRDRNIPEESRQGVRELREENARQERGNEQMRRERAEQESLRRIPEESREGVRQLREEERFNRESSERAMRNEPRPERKEEAVKRGLPDRTPEPEPARNADPKEKERERSREADRLERARERADREYQNSQRVLRERIRTLGGEYPAELCCSAVAGLEIQAQAASDAPARVSLTAYTGSPMKLDGFAYPVVVDLETLRVNRQSIPVLRSHDPERIAGHTTKIDVSPQRLKMEASLSGLPQYADEVVFNAGRGFPWQVSIGAGLSQKPEFVPGGESAKVNGRVWKGPVLVARNAHLREVSLLAMGADSDTSASFAEHPELLPSGA